MARKLKLLSSAAALGILMPNAFADAGQDYDPVREALVLIENQDFGRAEALIKTVEEDGDAEGAVFLQGAMALGQSNPQMAESKLTEAWSRNYRRNGIELLLCQAWLEAEKPERCLSVLPPKTEVFSEKHFISAMKALIMKEQAAAKGKRLPAQAGPLPESEAAWRMLQEGTAKFPASLLLILANVNFLTEKKLLHAADGFVRRVKNRAGVFGEEAYLLAAKAFRQAGALNSAAWILEESVLALPEAKRLKLELAQVYVMQKRFLSAGSLLQTVAAADGKYYLETAELYRRARAYAQALSANQAVPDEKERLKQRLIIFLDQERFGAATGMRGDLERLGLVGDNEEIAYGLAFAFYQQKKFTETEALLARVRRADLFKKATWIRQSMETCTAQKWECML